MTSKYIRHIDLEEVCKALPYWKKGRKLSSAPSQLWVPVMGAFLGFLSHPDFALTREQRVQVTPRKLAEMLDEHLELAWEALPSTKTKDAMKQASKRWSAGLPPIYSLPRGPKVYSHVMGSIGQTDPTIDALFIYQLDSLCGAAERQDMACALWIFTDLLELQRDIAARDGSDFLNDMTSMIDSWEATVRAQKKHRPTNQQKDILLAEWDANSNEYKSRADFARIVSAREGMKERTLYEWIASHDRKKST